METKRSTLPPPMTEKLNKIDATLRALDGVDVSLASGSSALRSALQQVTDEIQDIERRGLPPLRPNFTYLPPL